MADKLKKEDGVYNPLVQGLVEATPAPSQGPAPEGTGKQLWRAANSGQVAQVQALCERWGGHGEVINWAHPDNYGSTPLHAACDSPQCTAILLSTPGCEVNKGDNYGSTPLWGAALNGEPETVQALLAKPGIDLNKAPTGGREMFRGKSPLAIAQERAAMGEWYSEGCQEVATLLEKALKSESNNNFKITSDTHYSDLGQEITIDEGSEDKKKYFNRCFILSLANVMSYSYGVDNFYKNLLSSFDSFDKNQSLNEIQNTLYKEFIPSIRESRFIDAFIFFMFFNIEEVQKYGLIVTNPVDKEGNLIIDKNGKRGFYIKKVTIGSTGIVSTNELTKGTPIIYNLGNYHFVPGINGMPSRMLDAIKANYLDLTSLMGRSPITTGNAKSYNIQDNSNEELNCRFFGGETVSYAGDKYLIKNVIKSDANDANDDNDNCIKYNTTKFTQKTETGKTEAEYNEGSDYPIQGEQFKNFNKYAVFEPDSEV
jgi:hypothetical protein